ncbi:MAG: tetratricopeptide repeat protein [Calditrichaeota bacterium]|nr:MAG: tetratricopeptide repeat protein [Calditrichota bacterium]
MKPRRMRHIVSVLVLLIAVSLWAQSGASYYFQQGNQAYRNGRYEVALDWYRKIIDAGYESPELYYNMGNCYFKLNRIGPAILYYEKARRLKPDDPEIRFNLQLANSRVIDRIELPPQFFLFQWWEAVKHFFTISQLTTLTAVSYVLTMTLLTLYLFLRYHHWRRWLIGLLIVTTVSTVTFSGLLVLNVHEQRNRIEGVVLSPSVTVRSAPDENSTDVFVLHEGVKLRLDEQRGEWVKISLPDGKSGWMRQEHLGLI